MMFDVAHVDPPVVISLAPVTTDGAERTARALAELL
jgi:hypothetical protein